MSPFSYCVLKLLLLFSKCKMHALIYWADVQQYWVLIHRKQCPCNYYTLHCIHWSSFSFLHRLDLSDYYNTNCKSTAVVYPLQGLRTLLSESKSMFPICMRDGGCFCPQVLSLVMSVSPEEEGETVLWSQVTWDVKCSPSLSILLSLTSHFLFWLTMNQPVLSFCHSVSVSLTQLSLSTSVLPSSSHWLPYPVSFCHSSSSLSEIDST